MNKMLMKCAKKFAAGILTVTMIAGSSVAVKAGIVNEEASAGEGEAVAQEIFYESHAIKMTTSEKRGWNFNGPFEKEIELMPEYGGIEWPVAITCGYSVVLWVKSDYVTKVGGTATGYRACGLVGNDGDTKYTAWMEPCKLSGKISITHKGDVVSYGVKIHFGD